MALEGMTGTGKTTLIRRYATEFPRLRNPAWHHHAHVLLGNPLPGNGEDYGFGHVGAIRRPGGAIWEQWALSIRA